MAKTLRELYPSVQSREEILQKIMDAPNLKSTYSSWETKNQERFLDFCSGAKGVKMLYDGFFKELFNPDSKPHRLEELLSLLLKQKIKILHALPNESSFSVVDSLVIMDIVIQLADGSIANVECQRIGYYFTSQRAACYSADLLLRQYKRVKDESNKRNKKFNYKDIKKVYNIIFYEKSPVEFSEFPSNVTHHFKQISDTGLEMDLLQEFFFIPLDIVNQIYHNKGRTNNKLEAWFVFISNDNPEIIQKLISEYPEFEAIYQEVFNLCKNVEKVMNMFSEELRILDRNTMEYMIDDLQAQVNQKNAEIQNLKSEKDVEIQEKDAEIQRLQKIIADLQK